MNEIPFNFNRYISHSFIYKGNRIFIKDIKQEGNLIIVHLDGEVMTFRPDRVQVEFFSQLHSKHDPNNNSTEMTNTENNLPVQQNQNYNLTLNGVGILDGSAEVKNSLLETLKSIKSATTPEEKAQAIEDSKAIVSVCSAITDQHKVNIQALTLLTKKGLV